MRKKQKPFPSFLHNESHTLLTAMNEKEKGLDPVVHFFLCVAWE